MLCNGKVSTRENRSTYCVTARTPSSRKSSGRQWPSTDKNICRQCMLTYHMCTRNVPLPGRVKPLHWCHLAPWGPPYVPIFNRDTSLSSVARGDHKMTVLRRVHDPHVSVLLSQRKWQNTLLLMMRVGKSIIGSYINARCQVGLEE